MSSLELCSNLLAEFDLDALSDKLDKALFDSETDLMERSFFEFVKVAGPILFPDEFMEGDHIETVCNHVQAQYEGLFDNLVITLPPRHMKSTLISVLLVAWRLGPRKERKEWIFTSLIQKLSTRDCRKCRELILNPWFQERWPLKFCGDLNKKTEWEIEGGGKYDTCSKGTSTTGLGGHIKVTDDLHDLKDNPAKVAAGVTWWREVYGSRSNFSKTARPQQLLIGHRVADNDITGSLHETEDFWSPDAQVLDAEGNVTGLKVNGSDGVKIVPWKPGERLPAGMWVHLNLPCKYVKAHHCITPIWEDKRTVEGQLLWPEAYDEEWCFRQRRTIGVKAWDAQYQGDPHPEGSREFEPDWLDYRFKRLLCVEVERWIISIDCNFKESPSSDLVSMQLIAKIGPYYYVVDEYTENMSWTTLKRTAKEYYHKWKELGICPTVVIEEAANGFALCEEFVKAVGPAVHFKPQGSKVQRARQTTGIWECGQVRLPAPGAVLVLVSGEIYHLKPGRWVSDYVKQFKKFPQVEHDDSVDATSQGLIWLENPKNLPRGIPNVGLAA